MVGSSNPKRATSSLLGLPAELRDNIYEYALIKSETLDVERGQEQPALLHTCRQIRKEAIQLYFTENKFRVTVHSWRGVAYTPFRKALLKHRAEGNHHNYSVRLCEECSDHVDFSNLDKWLKAFHDDPKLVPGLKQNAKADQSRAATVARRTFGVVKSMAKRKWSSILEVLDPMLDAISVLQEEDEEDSEEDYDDWDDDDDDDEDDEDEDEDDEGDEDDADQ